MEPATLLHSPARLRLMALLYERGDVAAAAARTTLGLTPGNLDSHAKRLAEGGLLVARRVLTRQGFEVRYAITRHGIQAVDDYLAYLESVLGGVASQRTHPM